MSVSKRDYPYPPDEFDQIDPAERPKEVHAAKRSAWSRTWPFLLVVVLVPAAAIVAVKLLSAPSTPGSEVQNTVSPPAVTQPTDQPTVQPTEPTTEPTDQTPTEEPPTEEPPAVIDFGINLTVMNDVSNAFPGTRNQLAARTAARLITAGFTEATASTNHVQNERPTSHVYYGSPEDRATAEAVAEAVSIASVQEDAEVATEGIVVSLGDDFREL